MAEFREASSYFIETCCGCGIHFAVPVDYRNKRRSDHATFYCPNGHSLHYPGKSDCELMKEENQRLNNCLSNRNERITKLELSRRALKAHITIKKNKIEQLKHR